MNKEDFSHIAGFTDNNTTCECCGKTNLKGTYICIDINNTDHYYGSSCITKLFGLGKKMILESINKYNEEKLKEIYHNSDTLNVSIIALLEKLYISYYNERNYEEIKSLVAEICELWKNISLTYKLNNIPFYDNTLKNGYLYLMIDKKYNFINKLYSYFKNN